MQFLRTNTATRVTVGPFLDKTDGVTPETALTVTSCKLTLVVDDGGVPTLVLDTNPTASGGANDMVHIAGDDAGYYDLELAAGNVNYLGRAKIAITDAATHCPVFMEFTILPAMVYDSFVLGTDVLQADVTQWLGTAAATPTVAGVPEVDVTHLLGTAWLAPGTAGTPDVNVKLLSGDSVAADNAEAFFDGTGYAGTNNVIPLVTTTSNLTNAPTAGDFTATMKTSIQTAATASIVAFFGANLAATIASFWAAVVSTGFTALQVLRLVGAGLGGKTSGAGTATITLRNLIDTLDAVVIGMTGSNRTSFTFDLSA